ncbi:MAG: hypothetical protein WBF33_27280, partial [Candidatus Nitrosopolaris sp.]
NDTSREVHEMFKTTAIDTLKQDKKCQACWYMILSTMSGSTTITCLHPMEEETRFNAKKRQRCNTPAALTLLDVLLPVSTSF